MGQGIAHTVLLLAFVALTGVAGCNALTGVEGDRDRPGTALASGRIEGDEYNAGAKVNGKVDQIPVKEGQSVARGTFLGSISSDQLKAQLSSADEEVRISRNKVAQAGSALAQSKADTQARIDQANANLNLSREQLFLSRRLKVTVLVTTHYMDEAEQCDRISLMHLGKLIALGSSAALKNQVIRDIGSMLEVYTSDPFTSYDILGREYSFCNIFGRTIHLYTKEPDSAKGTIAQKLAPHGIEVQSIKEKLMPLEDVFVYFCERAERELQEKGAR